ncbi:DUF6701 domain-containing protein [Glaciecola sp. 2405UD65-10]|uniref:DUF6701 domain-containing protein n=1 Tax=Glaciecola sp. 2405UD65-10 TaxID=3397244 RepID=UPI003B5914CC
MLFAGYSNAQSSPEPLAKFTFEEVSSNQVSDSSGNGYVGNILSNTSSQFSSPAINGSPGTCDYISQIGGAIQVRNLPVDTSSNGTKTTVAFWMYWDGTEYVMPIGWNRYNLFIYRGGFGFNTSNNDVYGISVNGLANSWHHVVAVFNNGNVANSKIYIDGVLKNLSQRTGTPSNGRSYVKSEMRIGGWSANSSYRFHGLIDEVQVFDGELSSAQVTTLVNETYSCKSRPVANYQFDENVWIGATNEVSDSSGYEHHGVSINMTTTENGKICAAGDFTATGTSDYLSLAKEAADGLSDFSVSVWSKIDNLNSGAVLSGANANENNEMLMFFNGTSTFEPYIKSSRSATSNGGIGDGEWHHLVWTRSGRNLCYYVDGTLVECEMNSQSGAVSIDEGGLIIGQEQDSVGGSFQASQAWDGLLDELLIFDTALNESEITEVYTNQNVGNNYDGSTRFCQGEVTPVLEYRFEEEVWDGTPGEIIDYTGNENHANIISNSSPEIASPAVDGNPGTCGYASQSNGAIALSNVPLDTTAGAKTSIAFWMKWDGTNGIMPIGFELYDIFIAGGGIGFNTSNSDLYGMYSSGLANTWYHFVFEFTNGQVSSNKIYINGEEQALSQLAGSPLNNLAYVSSDARIGGWNSDSEYRFHGLIDEFRIYDGALSVSQINTIMNETHSCVGQAPHHYEIVHDGGGLTCEAENITVRACVDESCSSLSPDEISLDFLGNNTLISTETFTGSTVVSVSRTNEEVLTLSIANASIEATDGFICNNGSTNSCDLNYTNAAFKFLYAGDANTIIPNQVAGQSFPDTLQIQAVGSNNGVCESLFSGATSVNLSQENIEPSGNGGLSFTTNGNAIAKHPTTSSVSVNFDANSIATIANPMYLDAGNIQLHASYSNNGVEVSGSSNAFWVSPAQLVASVNNGSVELNGNAADSAVTHKAGESFNFSVSAVNALGALTGNYTPGQMQVALTRSAPNIQGNVDGSFVYANGSSLSSSLTPAFTNVNLSDFSGGVSSYSDASYSEVGLLSLDIQDANYGGQGIVLNADNVNIGRFIPHHFEQTIADDGLFQATCSTAMSFIAYSGQKDQETASKGAISYLTNPVLEITAYNKQGAVTQNYYQDAEGSENDFMKLSSSSIFIANPTQDEQATGVDGSYLSVEANLSEGILSQFDLTNTTSTNSLPRGVLHYQLSSDDHFFYPRSANTKVAPFTANINFDVLSVIDTDAIEASSLAAASPTGLDVYFGRLVLNNSFGPETEDLAQVLQVEYFDGDNFLVSSADNCLEYDASNLILSNISLAPSLTEVSGGTGQFVSGKSEAIILQAPGAGNQGKLGVSYDAFEWLLYDWDNDGVFDELPTATASFGVYKGEDKLIHWRENF